MLLSLKRRKKGGISGILERGKERPTVLFHNFCERLLADG